MKKINATKYKTRQCRICRRNNLIRVLDLGYMPTPNGYLKKDELSKQELAFPLGISVCPNCWLLQLTHIIPAEIMFKNYLYIPSTSQTMLKHFKSLAETTISSFNIPKNSLVVDVGSNDGTLLSSFKEKGMKVLGIDPAINLATVARLKGIETISDFFTTDVVQKIVAKQGKAKVITATNVVAHIDDLHGFCENINLLLDKEGICVIEFPYLTDLIEKNEFDTIYHEHLSYFSLTPLMTLFERHQLRIFFAKRVPVHGGSIRIFVCKKLASYKTHKIINIFLTEERLKKINRLSYYEDFSRRVKVIKRDLVKYLARVKKSGLRIVGYGASAKGNVLLNYCKIDDKILDYVVDSIPYKQGKYTPGSHLKIYPESRLEEDMPDYALLLSWNFAEEILQKQNNYREKGGQFIITIPYLRIE
ncbi:class I SAM-dependent methyltransferase [Candidatus Microgenomates bacterium]|nr:class I SAM-dependent methyltransferase [Candidatus Microgenomates bacterium]